MVNSPRTIQARASKIGFNIGILYRPSNLRPQIFHSATGFMTSLVQEARRPCTKPYPNIIIIPKQTRFSINIKIGG